MQVLVTGGAGYIGSHAAKQLARSGYEPIVLDNLRNGHRWAARWGPLIEMDLEDRDGLHRLFRTRQIGAVLHFAALAYVGESIIAPAEYFRNNVANTLNLLDAMRENAVDKIIFSSTCASYGNPEQLPISETHRQVPVNPYGESKLIVERVLNWYGRAYGLAWVALRYFNAAGADPEGEIGELHDPETHLIPRAIAAAHGDAPPLEVFGTDYATADGTAVRDYIHVTDLAAAHVRALEWLTAGGHSGAFNLGTGRGHSVHDVIHTIERIGQCKVPVRANPRRPGDPAILIADATLAARVLGWTPQIQSIEEIIATAWQWYAGSRSAPPQLRDAKPLALGNYS